MAIEKITSADLLGIIKDELSRDHHWVVYHKSLHQLEKGGMHFFKEKEEADDFVAHHVSDHHSFEVIHVSSVEDMLKQIRIEYPTPLKEMRNPDANPLYDPDGNDFTDALIDHIEEQQLINNSKRNVMNQKNFEYLKDQVKYTGFGEGLENDLRQKIEKGDTDFKLNHTAKYGEDTLNAQLSFSKSKQSDMYFFNSYQVSLQKENTAEKMEQNFYINKGNNITLKEAYNLMEGRSVNKDLTNKEGQLYNAWLQMDFKQSDEKGNFKLKQYHENYGYDLEAALGKHPIKELGNDEFKANLMDSLKKGNLQSATFQNGSSEQKHYIEANPQFKTINIYDTGMQRLDNRQQKSEKEAQGESSSVKQTGKKERQGAVEDDGPEIPKTANKRKKRQSVT